MTDEVAARQHAPLEVVYNGRRPLAAGVRRPSYSRALLRRTYGCQTGPSPKRF